MAALLPLPSELTSAAWKKNKSKLAKLVENKSGITGALEKVEKGYKALESAVNSAKSGKAPSQAMTSVWQKEIKDFRKVAGELEKLADKRAGEWKKRTSPVPKSLRQYTEEISKTAMVFCLQIDKNVREIRDELGEQEAAEIKKNLKHAVAKAKVTLDDIKANPTSHNYNSWMATDANPAKLMLEPLEADKYWINLGFSSTKMKKDLEGLLKLSKLNDDAKVAKVLPIFEAKIAEVAKAAAK